MCDLKPHAAYRDSGQDRLGTVPVYLHFSNSLR